MFLDIPSQVLICPHVCPYALLAFVDFALFCMLIRSLLFCLVIRSEERLFNVFLNNLALSLQLQVWSMCRTLLAVASHVNND